jgi:hypothetical protein
MEQQSKIDIEIDEASEPTEARRGLGLTLGLLMVLTFGFLALIMTYRYFPGVNAILDTTSEDATPTVVSTNLIGTIPHINQHVTVNGIQITVLQAQEAEKFSDIRKHMSAYTVRVSIQTQNNGAQPVGIPFTEQAELIFPDGHTARPQMISVNPITMPKTTQQGYIDFPSTKPIPLSGLVLLFGNNTTVQL